MRGRGWALALAVLVATTSCSLPLSHAVHTVGEVPAEQRPGGALQVIPPGPKADASPVDAVLGFLGAQASSQGGHAIAREFLSPPTRRSWRDDAEVQVYDPDQLVVTQLPGATGDSAVVRVTSRVSGRVRADGSFVVLPGVTVTEVYQLVRRNGRWLLDVVPEGLRLTAADRQRSFAPWPVYYLAPAVTGEAAHLVPDQVFLPVDGDLARTLVTRLLRAPSQALAGSVTSAVPAGARLRQVVRSSSGVVTVALEGVTARPSGAAAQDLSAQLVWTLRSLGGSFRGLRLLLDGQPLGVPGEGAVQDAGDWSSYDPEGLGPNPPYFFVSARRLRSSIVLPPSPATSGDVGDSGAVPVDVAAVTPDGTRAALLEGLGTGRSTVRIGPLRGRTFPVVARSAGLSSPSWGSGALGLWLLRGGREVVRVASGLHPITVLGLPPGRVDALALSRDGVRVALAVNGRLYVGRIERVSGVPRVVGLSPVLPGLRRVSHVSWATSTRLVVLGVLTRSVQVVEVAVDGSSVRTLNTAGLEPTEIAAAPHAVLLAAGGRLYLSDGGVFRQVQTNASSFPAFPG